MKFIGTARAAVFTAAIVAEVAGLGLAVVPAVALTSGGGGGGPANATMQAGGDRTSSTSVAGLGGVRFREQHANPSTCTTGGNGKCTLTLSGGDHRFTQEDAPSGWYLSPQLGISPNSHSTPAAAREYTALSAHVPGSGTSIPQGTSGTTTNPYARSGIWAASRDDPPVPASCGLNVALLFDLSSSVDGHLRDLQNAGIGFINTLRGTPSGVALYTMGTDAPVNLGNNSNFPLTPLTTQANVTALTNKINGYTISSQHPQYTNWDEGLWQIANAQSSSGGTRVHYDAVIVLNNGDPTVYGPTGIGQTHTAITRFIDVENAIFSANTLKAAGTRIIAVGVGASTASALNLRAISGHKAGRDFITTSFSQVGSVLRDLALEHCSGTVNVTKLVIPGDKQGDTSVAVPSPGWTMRATGRTVRPAVAVTNKTGALSFATDNRSGQVTVTENVKPGYTHLRVSGTNAVCRNLAGHRVLVSDASSGPGFTVTARAGDVITCDIYNQQQAPAEVTTRLSAADGEIPVRGTASDSARLHGETSLAGGTVAYRFYGSLAACDSDVAAFPAAAPSGGTLVSTEPVTAGVVPGSASAAFPVSGTFYWAAFYSGDAGNRATVSDCMTEPLAVTAAAARVTTALSAADGEVLVGGPASDTATLSGETGSAGGSVEYRFYGSQSACDADATAFRGTAPSGGTLVSTVPVTGGIVPGSASVVFGTAGTFYWAAFYSGDGSNAAAVSDCATEPLVVTPALSQVTTRLSAPGQVIGVGSSANDTAILQGATGTAGGSAEYRFYGSLSACDAAVAAFPGTAPSGGTLVSTVSVSGGVVPTSAAHVFMTAGTFYWAAFYSGDANNDAAASNCVTEPLAVTRAESQVTTRVIDVDGEIGVGGSAADTATLHGATRTAAGTLEYRFYGSLSACQSATAAFPPPGGGTLVSTVTVTRGGVPDSAPVNFTEPGRYYWAAFYSGDSSNQEAASICAAEPLVVTQAPQPPASIVVNMDWVIDGAPQRAPSQDPDFQASLLLNPLIPPGEPATWGEERFCYFVGQAIEIAVTDVTLPPGCAHAVSGHVGTHTLTAARNEFLVTITADCNKPATEPGVFTELTLVKQISSDFPEVALAPLTSWTLTARPVSGGRAVISGTTGVTGEVEPDTRYILAESTVPGYKQRTDPAVDSLTPGATGSWRCVEDHPGGSSELEDFDGGTGDVIVPPGEHVTCTAVNTLSRKIPSGPASTGGGRMAASQSAPLTAAGAALMATGALLALAGLRKRRLRKRRPRNPAPGA